MEGNTTQTVSVTLGNGLLADAVGLATRSGVSLSDVVGMALVAYLGDWASMSDEELARVMAQDMEAEADHLREGWGNFRTKDYGMGKPETFLHLVQDDGDELRTITAATRDGEIVIREASHGRTTELAFGTECHATTMVFTPGPNFGEDDVRQILSRDGEDLSDVYLTDVEDACDLRGVSYKVTKGDC